MTFSPSTSPLSADKADPVPLAEEPGANRHVGIEFDTHTEVQFEGWCGKLEGSGDISLFEAVQQIVCGDGILDHT